MSALPQVNAKRKPWLDQRNFTGPWLHIGIDHAAFVRQHDCIARMFCCDGQIQACHAISRGAGGDWSVLFPGCMTFHRHYDTGRLGDLPRLGEQRKPRYELIKESLGIDVLRVCRDLATVTCWRAIKLGADPEEVWAEFGESYLGRMAV